MSPPKHFRGEDGFLVQDFRMNASQRLASQLAVSRPSSPPIAQIPSIGPTAMLANAQRQP